MALEHVPRVAELHAAHLKQSFFATLGLGFLRRLYRRLVLSRHGLGFVHETDGRVDAFITAAYDADALRAELLRRDALPAALHVAVAALRRPWVLCRAAETLAYGRKTDLPDVAAEMLFISLEPERRREGLATGLIARVLAEFQQASIGRVKVTTEADNEPVNRLLAGLGFETQAEFRLHGKLMRLHARSLAGFDPGAAGAG